MFSSMITPRLSDKYYGRKKPYLCSMIGCSISYIMIYFSKSIYFNILCFFFIGLCGGGRVFVGISYMNEFIPENYHNLTISCYQLGDCVIMIYQALFYLYFPDWNYIYAPVFLIVII